MAVNNIPYQQDVKVKIVQGTNERCTLDISPTGDLQLTDGTNKLSQQLMRIIVNDDTILKNLFNNTRASKVILPLMTTILRGFRETQIEEVNGQDPTFSGYNIYRRASNSLEAYSLISPRAIVNKYIDTNLLNGTTYVYSLTKTFNNVLESDFIDTFSISPSRFSNTQQIIIGSYSIAIAGDRQVTFYVDYNKHYQGSELLESIETINITQDPTEPRRFVVEVSVRDYNDNIKSLSATSRNPVT